MLQKNMKTYCVKCRKNTDKLNSKIFKTKNGRLIMQSKCAECQFKKSNLNSKLVIMLGFELKDTSKIGQKKFLLLVKLKAQFIENKLQELEKYSAKSDSNILSLIVIIY